jgi:hypothetical protein
MHATMRPHGSQPARAAARAAEIALVASAGAPPAGRPAAACARAAARGYCPSEVRRIR